MLYNIITFKDGSRKKCDGKLTEAEIRFGCEQAGIEIINVERIGLLDYSEENLKEYRYKVRYGYDDDMVVSITEKDLEKAVYAWVSQKKVNLSDVLLDGKYIMAITEDLHSPMGWNSSHKIQDDDWNELRQAGVLDYYKGKINNAKERVQELLVKGRKDLIGQNLSNKEILQLN